MVSVKRLRARAAGGRRPGLLALVAATALLAALPQALAARGPATARAAGKGTVAVLFAGSLVNYMERNLGPSFQRATGYSFQGFGGGSTELANEIKGGVRRGDVFLSASATADRALEGSTNGSWVSWYTSFMASPLMLAYNPHSKFGAELAHGTPWYRVLTQPGIRVGRTDPKLDPKGVLSAEAIAGAASKLHLPALSHAEASFETFPETSLVGRMQAGQLDAGFFYAVEAKTAKLPTVSLAPVYKYAEYTITILNHAPNPTGAASLIRYLLNTARTYTLKQNGLNPMKPRFTGGRTAVPATLRKLVGSH